ncbi:hypothetical protein HDU98_000846 [Podochytrium sp. JEL0797]|nr:hypothetical protein HDU98_000846 [Podochytrium sp. JEL0797]
MTSLKERKRFQSTVAVSDYFKEEILKAALVRNWKTQDSDIVSVKKATNKNLDEFKVEEIRDGTHNVLVLEECLGFIDPVTGLEIDPKKCGWTKTQEHRQIGSFKSQSL